MTRSTVYALLITVAAGSAAARITAVQQLAPPPREPMPTLGANDRSRWDTIRALVDHGTYVIGTRDPEHGDRGIAFEEGWKTIDKVLHPETNEFYSSKPPLLPTIVACEYWLLKHTLGWSITDDRWWVVRTILLTINGLPWIVFLALIARLVEDLGQTDWGRLYVVFAACFGTLLTPFLVTLNNHTPAACTTLAAVWFGSMVSWPAEKAPRAWPFALAGLFAGLTATFELPATSFAVFFGVLLAIRSPARVLLHYLPAALVPILVQLGLNYLALGQFNYAYSKFGTEWYAYEGSHWHGTQGIDAADEDRWTYAFHFLLGHHGAFSLTPIFLLSLAGMGMCCRGSDRLRGIGLVTLATSVTVVCFYVWRTNNYGGWCCGVRWLIWLTPLWLLVMLPAADYLAERRWGRGLSYVLLGMSVFSASYPTWSPWRHPWLYQVLQEFGWKAY